MNQLCINFGKEVNIASAECPLKKLHVMEAKALGAPTNVNDTGVYHIPFQDHCAINRASLMEKFIKSEFIPEKVNSFFKEFVIGTKGAGWNIRFWDFIRSQNLEVLDQTSFWNFSTSSSHSLFHILLLHIHWYTLNIQQFKINSWHPISIFPSRPSKWGSDVVGISEFLIHFKTFISWISWFSG